jgi:NAD(P)-dependent dehydrogenase (short-subunit alcohol dehydrogenase family)
MEFKSALIVGAGPGLSASLARQLAQSGPKVALAARNSHKLASLCSETGSVAFACDATDPAQVTQLFADVDAAHGAPDLVVYNASARAPGPITDISAVDVQRALAISAFGGFLVGQQAALRMVPKASGVILFTGASASVKGYKQSAAFAMGKFALRGLAQSMARELAPKGVHVAHVVIDGGIRSERRPTPSDHPDSLLDPEAIALAYLQLARQDRSAWTWEIELRPWIENF